MTEPKKMVLPGLPGAEPEGARAMQKAFTQANFIASYLHRKLEDCPGEVKALPVAIASLSLAAKALSDLSALRPEVVQFLLTAFSDACEAYGVNWKENFPAGFELWQVVEAGGSPNVQ